MLLLLMLLLTLVLPLLQQQYVFLNSSLIGLVGEDGGIQLLLQMLRARFSYWPSLEWSKVRKLQIPLGQTCVCVMNMHCWSSSGLHGSAPAVQTFQLLIQRMTTTDRRIEFTTVVVFFFFFLHSSLQPPAS